MSEKYDIGIWQDDTWAVYEKVSRRRVFAGSLEEVHAWIALKEKGFDI